jgi:HK97 family phage major capsid protein
MKINRFLVSVVILSAAALGAWLGYVDPAALATLGLIGQTAAEDDLATMLQQLGDEARKSFKKVDEIEGRQTKLQNEQIEIQQKLDKFAGSAATRFGGGERDDEALKEMFTKAAAGLRDNTERGVRIALPAGIFESKAIVNATGQNQPLVPADRLPGIQSPVQRRISILDLLPTMPTSSNMIEYTKENVFTNNAAPVYNSPEYENVTKPESQITFTLATARVITLAHFIRASKQVLDDSSALLGYLDNRLTYGLRLVCQDEVLNGDGTGAHLDGLMHQATPYAGAGAVSADSQIDTLRRAIGQLEASEYQASAIVVNPADWMKLELIKETTGKYIFGDPADKKGPTMWGVPVVVTNQIAATRFLVGDMQQAGVIFDRQQPTMELSAHDGDNFTKNMLTIRVESRMALAVIRATALIRGNFN